MGNQLDEMNPTIMDEGRQVDVITKQLPVKTTVFEKILPGLLYLLGLVAGVLGLVIVINGQMAGFVGVALGLILIIYVYKKMKDASAYFSGLEQKINTYASEIDNYLEQRVIVLENARDLIEKSIEVDKDIFKDLAKYRSGNFSDEERQKVDGYLREAEKNINVALEAYPLLQSQQTIMDAMNQNAYLQREITAARSAYNDAVYQWNRDIFVFPFNKIVAAREKKTTRIPYIAPREVKEAARGKFFE